jgi:predicted bacteriocin transport accessory protein
MSNSINTKTVLLPFILIMAFIAGFLLGINDSRQQEEPKILPSYDDTVNWEVISFDEAMNHWDDDQAILFYGFNDCPYCTAAKPVLGAVSYNNNDAVDIYYVDVAREERVEGNSTYDLTLEHFRDFLKTDKMYVPYVVFIKEGRVLGGWTGTVDGHDLKTGLTSIQICQLYGIYNGLYNQIA